MRVELIRRPNPSPLFSAVSPLLALAIMILLGAIMFALLTPKGPDQIVTLQERIQFSSTALYTYFVEPLTETWSLHELLIKAAPLILIAVGLSVCFLSNNWNIGAEGQFIVGAIAGSIIPIVFPGFGGPLVLPLMLFMGVLGGMAYAAIPAILKARFNTSEILSSLMLVYVAQLFLDWIVRGPWRNPEGFNFPESRSFNADAILPEIVSSSGRAHYGFVFALIAALVMWFLLNKTLKGFEIRVLGQSPRAGRFAGFSYTGTVITTFLIAGGLAGLAGIGEVSGAIGQLRPVISPGYGFTAIIVAFLGRLNPLGIVAAGLVLALSYLGGEAVQMLPGGNISNKVASIFQGFLLFSVLACDTLIHYRIRIALRAGAAG
jgi:ABC-type uncharacterized transport system permease subunit